MNNALIAKELLVIAGSLVADEIVPNLSKMTLGEIASVVSRDWKNVYFGAKPYLDAMYSLQHIDDNYGQDPGTSIVAYFLSNASQWRGDVAKAVKNELKRRLR